MMVSGFMVPADKVVKCEASDSVQDALDKILENGISAIVVTSGDKAIGIVTKTDIARAYRQGTALDAKVESIMSANIKTVKSNVTRDGAAAVIEANRIHHVIVVGNSGEFLGLVSSWDVAKECVLDSKAWPWNRTEDGRVHPISSPKSH